MNTQYHNLIYYIKYEIALILATIQKITIGDSIY